MLISMYILTQREIEKINFEYVFSEYEKYVTGLGATDERYFKSNFFIFSLPLIDSFYFFYFKAFK